MNASVTTSLMSWRNASSFYDPYMSTMGNTWDIVIALVVLCVIITGFTLNSLVLWILIRLKATQPHKKPVNSDYYIMALAASDLLVVLSCYPLTFMSTISHRWLFGDVGCAINGFFGFLFSLIDIGALTMMSLHRLLSVKMPHCAFVRSAGYTWVALVGVVLYALVWTVSPLLGWGRFAPEPFGTSCTIDWKNPSRSYVTSVFTGVLTIPMLVMLMCYSSIVFHMRATSAKFGPYLTERKKREKRQNRLVRIAVLMCTCFLVIWLPYSVLSICFSYVPGFSVHPVHSAIPTVLAKASHVVNPLICFATNKSYRRLVRRSFLYCFLTIPDFETSKSCQASTEMPDWKSVNITTQLPTSTFHPGSPGVSMRLLDDDTNRQRICQNYSSYYKDNYTTDLVFVNETYCSTPIPAIVSRSSGARHARTSST
uniref:Opsin-5A n=1 Tax=Ambigolimax valentianus TaxID=1338344 RepID=A0A455SGG5_9EUPU|nr:opsin-5A [Ambigolimax valentianus]